MAGKGREKRASKADRLSSLSDQTIGIVGDGEEVKRDINRNHRNLAKLPGESFFGLAGLGNLLLGTAPESRMSSLEYQLGLSLARGTTPPEWQTEGTRALATAAEMADKLDVEAAVFPVIDAVVRRRLTPDQAADQLGRLEIDLE